MLGAILMSAAGSLKYVGSMTAGITGTFTGLLAGSFGSRTPTALFDGMTLALLTDDSGTNSCSLRITGFSGDPGTAYLKFISANGVAKTGGAASYVYGAGAATWTWAAQTFGFVNGVTYPVVIA